MRALDKLQDAIKIKLRATTIMEPSNATAARHVRVLPSNITLTPLPKSSPDIRYMPYACTMDIVLSYRLRGGNVDNYLTDVAMTESMIITEMLTQGVITIKDVAEDVTDLEALKIKHPGWALKIVGDALLFNAKRKGDGFANQPTLNEMDEVLDEMMVYEDQWAATLSLTVHRHFPNPLLKTIILSNDAISEDIYIE